ncbi:unnamed protein product [Lampetra fluviatilis]
MRGWEGVRSRARCRPSSSDSRVNESLLQSASIRPTGFSSTVRHDTQHAPDDGSTRAHRRREEAGRPERRSRIPLVRRGRVATTPLQPLDEALAMT